MRVPFGRKALDFGARADLSGEFHSGYQDRIHAAVTVPDRIVLEVEVAVLETPIPLAVQADQRLGVNPSFTLGIDPVEQLEEGLVGKLGKRLPHREADQLAVPRYLPIPGVHDLETVLRPDHEAEGGR